MATRNISDIHIRIDDIARKERGVFFTSAQIDRALDDGQKQTYQDYYNIFLATKDLPEALRRFRIHAPFASNSSGYITYPTELQYLLELYTVAGSTINIVREVNAEELPLALKSQLRPVALVSPIGHQLSKTDNTDGYQLYPQSSQVGTITYLRKVTTPIFGYTQVGRVVTYDPNSSTQIDFNDVFADKIIAKALTYLGINMEENEIIEFGNLKDQSTTQV